MIFDFHPYCSVSSVLSSELTTCHMVTTCFISHAVSAHHFLYNTSELGHQAVVWIKLYFLMMIIFLGGGGNWEFKWQRALQSRALCALTPLPPLALCRGVGWFQSELYSFRVTKIRASQCHSSTELTLMFLLHLSPWRPTSSPPYSAASLNLFCFPHMYRPK